MYILEIGLAQVKIVSSEKRGEGGQVWERAHRRHDRLSYLLSFSG